MYTHQHEFECVHPCCVRLYVRLCVPVGTLQGVNSEKYRPVHREQAAPGQKSHSQGHIG